ncbi:Endopeptidase Clp, partial [human gut metagenome]
AHLDELRTKADLAERNGDFEEAGRLRYGEMPALEKQIRDAEASEAAAETVVGPDGVERAASEPMIAEKGG